MSQRLVVAFALVVMLGLAGWGIAQQEQKAPPSAPAATGRFLVSTAGDSAILVDTQSGQTWKLVVGLSGHEFEQEAVWLPVRRIDTEGQAQAWIIRQRKFTEELRRK